MTERILFVCTANICRSPMAEALLRADLETRAPVAEVRSAGFLTEASPADRNAIWALDRLGLDLSSHLSAKVVTALEDKPDLVLVMARDHLRSLSLLVPGALDRAFTLKEFVYLGGIEGERRQAEPLADYITRVRAGRSLSAITSPGTEDDVEDPIGRGRSNFARCATELQGLVRQLADLLYPFPDSAHAR